MKRLTIDASLPGNSQLRSESITESDLSLFHQFGIKDWKGKKFDETSLIKFDKWVVNEDKSVIFKALGGGGFEIPEMYDLIYKGVRVHLECGGGGNQAWIYVKNDEQRYDTTVLVTRIQIPPELSGEQDSVLALIVDAFAALPQMSSMSEKFTVEFNL